MDYKFESFIITVANSYSYAKILLNKLFITIIADLLNYKLNKLAKQCIKTQVYLHVKKNFPFFWGENGIQL